MKAILKNQSTISSVSIDNDENHLIRPLSAFIEPTNKYHLLKVCTVDTEGNFVNPGGSVELPKNKTEILRAQSALSSNWESDILTNDYYVGGIATLNVIKVGTNDIDIAFNIVGYMNGDMRWVILESDHITEAGFYSLKVYPGSSPSPNLSANDVLSSKIIVNIKVFYPTTVSCEYRMNWML